VVLSRRYVRGRALLAAAATSLAATGMIAMSATALADASGSTDAPLPGTAIIHNIDRGVAQDNGAAAISAPRGTAYNDGDDASKAAPILIHDGNQSPLCFANGQFDNTACGLG
jgi:hypothetical protein